MRLIHIPVPALLRDRVGRNMACILFSSTTFTVPLLTNNNFHQRLHQLHYYPLNQFSTKSTITTAQNIIGSRNPNKHTLFVQGRGSCHHHCFMSLARFQFETYCYKGNVNSCSNIVISGYWVGPDADDGWGFVEAFIDQIT